MESFLRDGVDLRVISNKTIAGDAHFFEDSTSPDKIREYLESMKESEKLKGMKWLLAMLSKGRDVAEFFADVVKNVVVKSVEVKKMVYIYLVHYADFNGSCREIALLSINTFQKDMAGTNQLIRGLALRVMTSIRVPEIIQIQLLAVRKCATDSSPYVRRCAATALPKIYSLDPQQLSHLKQILEKLLRDTSTMVLGSAVASFNEVCPTSYEILHRGYRKLCHLLADMDEWTQVSVLEAMTRYVRNQFTDPAPGVAAAVKLRAKQRSTSAVKGRNTIKRRVVRKAFYSDEEDESDEEEVEVEIKAEIGSVFTGTGSVETDGDFDPDHRLILRSSLPLLKSRNSAVVLAVCALHYYCGSQNSTSTSQLGKALVRILRNQREIQYVVLTCISTMAQERPAMFRPFLQDFFVKGTDPVFNRLLKLEIISSIATKDNIQPILRELQSYVKHGNKSFVCAALRAVGRVADAHPEISDNCMEGILHLMYCNKTPEVVSESVVVIRQLLQQNGCSDCGNRILQRLVKMLVTESGLDDSTARASVVWLVGEFHSVLQPVAPDILRLLAAGFADEETETRMQILNLAIKQSLHLPDDENVQSLMTYVLEMARYDPDTDLRDRSRMMTALMGLAPSGESGAAAVDEEALEELSEHAQGIILAPRLPPLTLLGPVDVDGLPNFTVGSLSSLVGHRAAGYDPIPSWPDVQPDLHVRDALRYPEGEDDLNYDSPSQRKASKAHDYNTKEESSSSSSSSESGSDDDNVAPKDFYDGADNSVSESEEENSSEEEEEDSEEEDDSESDDEQDSEDEEEEEEEESAVRIPLNLTAAQKSSRLGIKKVTSHGKLHSSASTGTGSVSATGGLLTSLDLDHLYSNTTPLVPTSNTVSNSLFDIPDSPFTQPTGHITSSYGIVGAPTSSTSIPPNIRASSDDMVLSNIMESFSIAPTNSISTPHTAAAAAASSSFPASPVSDFTGLQFPAMPTLPSNSPSISGTGFTGRSTSSSINPTALPEIASEPKVLLKPEIGAGLSVSLVFRFGARAAVLPGANCVFLLLRNNSDQTIRRIKISFPSEIRRTPIDDIPTLSTGEEVQLPMEIILFPNGATGRQPIRLEVRCDKGTFPCTLLLDAWDALTPLALSVSEFVAARQLLGGFNEVVSSVILPFSSSTPVVPLDIQGGGKRKDLVLRIRKLLNVFPVNTTSSSSDKEEEEYMFAGSVRKGTGMAEDKLLISLRPDDGSTNTNLIHIRINTEDAMLGASLSDTIKKSFLLSR